MTSFISSGINDVTLSEAKQKFTIRTEQNSFQVTGAEVLYASESQKDKDEGRETLLNFILFCVH